MKSFAVIAALTLVLGSAPLLAQGTAPASPPPAAQAAPAQPKPFPEGTKFAFINIQRVAGESTEGKASTARVQALNQQKVTQLNDLNKKLQADQAKLSAQTSVMSEAARGQLERDIDASRKRSSASRRMRRRKCSSSSRISRMASRRKLLPDHPAGRRRARSSDPVQPGRLGHRVGGSGARRHRRRDQAVRRGAARGHDGHRPRTAARRRRDDPATAAPGAKPPAGGAKPPPGAAKPPQR